MQRDVTKNKFFSFATKLRTFSYSLPNMILPLDDWQIKKKTILNILVNKRNVMYKDLKKTNVKTNHSSLLPFDDAAVP